MYLVSEKEMFYIMKILLRLILKKSLGIKNITKEGFTIVLNLASQML